MISPVLEVERRWQYQVMMLLFKLRKQLLLRGSVSQSSLQQRKYEPMKMQDVNLIVLGVLIALQVEAEQTGTAHMITRRMRWRLLVSIMDFLVQSLRLLPYCVGRIRTAGVITVYPYR